MHRRSGQLLARAGKPTSSPGIARPAAGSPPAWAGEWVEQSEPGGARWVSIRQPLCEEIDGGAVERRARDAYAELLERLGDEHNSHIVRIWNFVPGILADAGAGLNRYMRFNAGRHRAFCRWLGSENHFDDKLPAASAVGIEGTELVIHALVLPAAGVTVHNPRQRAPHRYSTRFGPLPPCFARATLIDHADLGRSLLVGGTASVRGEDSVHPGSLDLQLHETLQNLEAVAGAAFDVSPAKALSCYRELRVYHPRRQDESVIRSAIVDRFGALRRIEFVVADLCRPELLVEIEGLACDVARPARRS